MAGNRERLPKWAQDELSRLENLVDMLETTVSQLSGTKASRVECHDHGVTPTVFLDDHRLIRFKLDPEEEAINSAGHMNVSADFEEQRLVVRGARAILVQPHASNLVHVTLRPR